MLGRLDCVPQILETGLTEGCEGLRIRKTLPVNPQPMNLDLTGFGFHCEKHRKKLIQTNKNQSKQDFSRFCPFDFQALFWLSSRQIFGQRSWGGWVCTPFLSASLGSCCFWEPVLLHPRRASKNLCAQLLPTFYCRSRHGFRRVHAPVPAWQTSVFRICPSVRAVLQAVSLNCSLRSTGLRPSGNPREIP